MRVAFEKALGETQLLLNTGSHGAGDNVAVELKLLLHGGPESGGDLLRAGFGGSAICGAIIVVIVAVAGHGCGGGGGLRGVLGGRGGEGRSRGSGVGCCGGLLACLKGWLFGKAATGHVGKSLSHTQGQ